MEHETKKIYCRHCGSQVTYDSTKCTGCGSQSPTAGHEIAWLFLIGIFVGIVIAWY